MKLAPDTVRIQERNRIAIDYMTQNGIQIDDLYTLAADHPEYYHADATHFNDRGKVVEANRVSGAILTALASR